MSCVCVGVLLSSSLISKNYLLFEGLIPFYLYSLSPDKFLFYYYVLSGNCTWTEFRSTIYKLADWCFRWRRVCVLRYPAIMEVTTGFSKVHIVGNIIPQLRVLFNSGVCRSVRDLRISINFYIQNKQSMCKYSIKRT